MSSLAFTTRTGSNSSSAAATTIAVTVTVNAGDTVVVACATVNTAIQAPTDDASGGSNVYIPVTNRITNTDSVQLWICYNAKAATTVTMHCTSSRLSCCVACYTGASIASTGATATGSGTALSVATKQDAADSWIVAGFAHVGTGTFSANVGNLRVSVAGAGSTTPGSAIVDNNGTAGSSITTSCTNTGSTAWAAANFELQTAATLPLAIAELPMGHYAAENVSY